jgi:hypothetical protein
MVGIPVMLICKIEDILHYEKKNQLNAQLILSIFRQPLHVSGVSRPIIRRYNRMYTTIGTYYPYLVTACCPGWAATRTTGSHQIRI